MGLTFKLGTAAQVTTNYIPKANSNSFSNSLIFDNGTNIGIGTTSPDTLLHLSATQGTSKIASTSTSAANAPYLTFFHAGNDEFRISGGDGLRFISSGVNERMRITGGGNVGIGTSSPAERLDVIGGAVAAGNGTIRTGITYSSLGLIGTFTNHDLGILTNGSERLRITNGGNVQIGTSSINLARVNILAATTSTALRLEADSSYNAISIAGTGNLSIDFPGVASGRFLVDNNGNTYNRTGVYGTVSSDYRLKENIVEASSKLNDLLKLRVVNFNLISDTEKKKNIGFIAQELKEVFPSLVYEQDTRQYDEEGNIVSGFEDSLGIKVGMEFAILVKAIQELSAKVSALENKS